jgi:hypothetical protein
MGAAGREATALLVVPAWRLGPPARVAARITSTLDVTRSERVTVTVAGVEPIAAAVRQWLEELAPEEADRDVPVTEE